MKTRLCVPLSWRDTVRGHTQQVALNLLFVATFAVAMLLTGQVAHADNFTDIFYTNSFRGAFEWLNKVDWIGMIVQGFISIASILGVALIAIRILATMLVISAPGLWNDVHDYKNNGDSNLYDFGLVGMAKTWASGKAGTGFDAIIGAVLILLPDMVRWSDFSDKSGMQLDSGITMSQYFLKIALPTVMAVFFFAMGFNGTLWRALAVTVDGMGAIAEHAVSVNYAKIVDDLVNSGTGYRFTFESYGTKEGDFKNGLAKDLYGRAISFIDDPTPTQLQTIGATVEEKVNDIMNDSGSGINCASWMSIDESIRSGLSDNDSYWKCLSATVEVGYGSTDSNSVALPVSVADLLNGVATVTDKGDGKAPTLYIFFKSENRLTGQYFNTDQITSE